MLVDAGGMLRDAGDTLQPDAGAQDTPVQCEKAEVNHSEKAVAPTTTPQSLTRTQGELR
jgi:hypothetical protein